MSPVKAVIADDEPELQAHLARCLADVWPQLVICGQATNGRQAVELIHAHRPDIVFLDIRMPGLTGMQVAQQIAGQCHIVFITAYDQYAVEAFEAQAVDYLLKPVGRKRLEKTVARLKQNLETPSAPSSLSTTVLKRIVEQLAGQDAPGYLQWLRVPQRDGIRMIAAQDVCYFKAGDKYVTVATDTEEFLIKKPIKELTDELDPNLFWRIHRSTIVNITCIDKVSRSLTGQCILRLKQPETTLTVSRSYAHLFKQT